MRLCVMTESNLTLGDKFYVGRSYLGQISSGKLGKRWGKIGSIRIRA